MHADNSGGMTPTELIVAQIWALELAVGEVRPDSEFFQLGGDSVLALTMLFQVGQKFGLELQPATLFEDSTLRGFCRTLDRVTGGDPAGSDAYAVSGSI